MVGKWRNHSNLRSFLSRTTPAVPVYTLPKDLYWQPILQSKVEYFNLVDLWDQYSEWSAYGLGVPIILDNCDSVVQYYVPFLSAIQIYSSKSHALMSSTLEDNERESFSDDSESEKLSRSSDAVSDDSLSDQEVSLSTRHLLGQLYLHYIEYGSPYGRIPLVDKKKEGDNSISLLPFGLATYKLQGGLWMNHGIADSELMSTLYNAAHCRLKQLGVEHHDFDFFTTH